MKILMLCAQSPWPPEGGTPLRSWGWLRAASRIADIGLVSLTGGGPGEQVNGALAEHCDYISLVPAPRSTGVRLRDLLLAVCTGAPYVMRAARSARMLRAVATAIDQWQPDIVQAEWLGAAPYLAVAWERGLPTVYAAHNVEHQVTGGLSCSRRLLSPPVQTGKLLKAETSYARNADAVVTVSEQDKKWFQQLNEKVICIPNAVYPGEYRFLPPSARAAGPVVFIGHLRYRPNLEAAMELLRSIFPLIRRGVPETKLVVAGKRPPQKLRRLAGGGVSILGDIGDMRAVWDRAAVLVSPLRSGGGSRIKLLEAAACGVPVIATRFSAAGLALQPDRDFVAAESPDAMAAACVRLLRNPGQWDGLALQAGKTVELQHNWDNLTDKLQQLYESLAHHHR